MKLFGVAADLAKDIASKGASLAPDMFVADEAAEQSILCATCGRQNPDTGLLFRYCSSCGSLLERQALRPEEVARALIVSTLGCGAWMEELQGSRWTKFWCAPANRRTGRCEATSGHAKAVQEGRENRFCLQDA